MSISCPRASISHAQEAFMAFELTEAVRAELKRLAREAETPWQAARLARGADGALHLEPSGIGDR
jgi:hypothetical protein